MTNDTPPVTSNGDSISGGSTATTTGVAHYSISQTNSTTDGSGDYYTLTGTGANAHNDTYDYEANDGAATDNGSGQDTYTLTQTGQSGGISGKQYALTLSGQDGYSTADTANTQDGTFTQSTTGSGMYARDESGSTAGTPYSTSTTGATDFTTTETGNSRDGSVTVTNTGTSRYGLLNSFNVTADGSQGTSGAVDFSPVGTPVYIGRATVPAGTFEGVGDDRFKYCFAAGTLVLMADGSVKPIEMIEASDEVLAAPEFDPKREATPCEVTEVFRNEPAALMEIVLFLETQSAPDAKLYCTANHRFYVLNKGWMRADELSSGDSLLTNDGSTASVDSVTFSTRQEPVFNISVARFHTYFVKLHERDAAVLVHNDSAQLKPQYRAQSWTLAKDVLASSFGLQAGNVRQLQAEYDKHGTFAEEVDKLVPRAEQYLETSGGLAAPPPAQGQNTYKATPGNNSDYGSTAGPGSISQTILGFQLYKDSGYSLNTLAALRDASNATIGTSIKQRAFIFQANMEAKYTPAFGVGNVPVGEAARHIFWQAYLTRRYGATVAKQIGDIHEIGQAGDPDSERDQANNRVARAVAARSHAATEDEFDLEIEQAIRNGEAYNQNIADPMHPVPLVPSGPLPPLAPQAVSTPPPPKEDPLLDWHFAPAMRPF